MALRNIETSANETLETLKSQLRVALLSDDDKDFDALLARLVARGYENAKARGLIR